MATGSDKVRVNLTRGPLPSEQRGFPTDDERDDVLHERIHEALHMLVEVSEGIRPENVDLAARIVTWAVRDLTLARRIITPPAT